MSTSTDTSLALHVLNDTDITTYVDIDWVDAEGMPVSPHLQVTLEAGIFCDTQAIDESKDQIKGLNCFISFGEKPANLYRLDWPVNKIVLSGEAGKYKLEDSANS